MATTVALLAVTGWYATLTRRIAEANTQAAAHAETAAKASLAAVAAAEASVDVAFDVEPRLHTTLGEVQALIERVTAEGMSPEAEATSMLRPLMRLGGVDLLCQGAAVFVHECRLDAIERDVSDRSEPASGLRVRATETVSERVDLTPRDQLPRRLHKGESVAFSLPHEVPGDQVVRIDVTLLFSFSDSGKTYERRLDWSQRPEL
jgi:hypothetical protein